MATSSYFVLFLAALYVSSANAAQALPANLEALETSVLRLMSAKQDPKVIMAAVVSMTNLVETFLMPHLATLHHEDYQAMKTSGSSFESCQQDHESYPVSIQSFSDAHKACRFEESDLKQQVDLKCGETKKRKADKFIAECAMFALVSDLPDELPGVCNKKSGGTNQGEALRLADYFKGLSDTYDEWEFKCEASENASATQNASCDHLTSTYGNKSAECDQKQTDLDSAACSQYRQGDCKALHRCWEQATQNFIVFNKSIANAVIARKAEFAGLQKILCYLDIVNTTHSNNSEAALVRAQVGLVRTQDRRTQLACETFIAGKSCLDSHCVWRQAKCHAVCSVFKTAASCPVIRCSWNGNSSSCQDNQEASCGDDYRFSHNGYWANIYQLQYPFGKVPRSVASTVEQCRKTCNSVTGCTAFSLGTDTICWIYDSTVGVDWVETTGSRSPACRHWGAAGQVTHYIGSVCEDNTGPSCEDDRWNINASWDNGIPKQRMDAVLGRSGKITVKGNDTSIYTGGLIFKQGSNLVVEHRNAVIGCHHIVMEDSSVLQNCQQTEIALPPIQLTKGHAHFEATCIGSAGSSTVFHGIANTDNAQLTIRGGNGHTIYFTGASWFAHLTALCHSAYAIHARAQYALGTGGVTIPARQQNCLACPILHLDVANTIDDGATLELNCQDQHSTIKIEIAEGVNEAVAALVHNNSRMPDGVYTRFNSDFITGGGSLIVGHVEDAVLCEMQSYDTSGLDITPSYYENHAPEIPSQPPCINTESWPRPGTKEYVEQEYDNLPEDAPARDCQSVCCLWCNYYDCPGGLHFENASCTKEYNFEHCCDSVGWRPTTWIVPVCNDTCGQAAKNATRTVHCQDTEGTVQPESECVNMTKPPEWKPYCEATTPCADCDAGSCNETGSYLKGCGENGGLDKGTCAYCTIKEGYYAIGNGGVNKDNCPSALCSDRAVCGAGQYLHGCGGLKPGECKSCQESCLIGYYADGCTGVTPGTCKLCNNPSGVLPITAGLSSDDQCDFVTQTQATSETDLNNDFTGSADFSNWNLDKDANKHNGFTGSADFSWIKLTEKCSNPAITPGWMSFTIVSAKPSKTYKVSAEASWWPTFGPGLKGDAYCNKNMASVLQFQASGAGNDDWVGASVTACFDQVTHFEWSKVWFDFVPITEGPVTLTFRESKLSCLSIRDVKIYELENE